MVWMAAHNQLQCAAVCNILIVDKAMPVRFSVQRSALDIYVFVRIILGDNRKRFAFCILWIEAVSHFAEYRAGNFIPCIAGTNRVETTPTFALRLHSQPNQTPCYDKHACKPLCSIFG